MRVPAHAHGYAFTHVYARAHGYVYAYVRTRDYTLWRTAEHRRRAHP